MPSNRRGANSIGKTVHIDDRNFKVAGVLAPWRPTVRYFDPNGNAVNAPEPIYLPFNFTPLMKIRSAGNSDGWRNYTIMTSRQCSPMAWSCLP